MSNKGVFMNEISYILPKEKKESNFSENRIMEHEDQSVSMVTRRPKLKSFELLSS